MIPMAAWERSPLTKEENAITEQPEPSETRTQIQQNQINTRISPNGEQRRQIDYIAISRKYRNTVKKARAIQNWRGNPTQQRQHAVIKIEIIVRMILSYIGI